MVHVVFLHPDLGIGGAERAVVDAALALKSRGHTAEFVTAHHDPTHCFQETRDGTFNVMVVGDWLPRSICGRCYALCAYIRMIAAAIYLVFMSTLKYDVVFCDQVSACIPVLRMSNAKVLFYCHFPDMLLTQRKTLLKKLYRKPLDWLEEKTTGMAQCILVNSKFTAGVFKETFTSLGHITPQTLYPIPDYSQFQKSVDPPSKKLIPPGKQVIFLSINRYERKKNLGLAIEALGELRKSSGSLDGIHLVMAGGYDERVKENVEHYTELKSLTEQLGLTNHVTFVRSFSDSEKRTLLHYATCLLYTPDREHFGIVPIEAMYMRCPVVAVNSGGPLETVDDGNTGFLCEPSPVEFANAMAKFSNNKNLTVKMGQAGHDRVIGKFSFEAFATQLNLVINNLSIPTWRY